jgi:hypothetical protein
MQNWNPDYIFEIPCPACGAEVEFWKDEPMRKCDACKHEIRNPRIDLGCAKWCKAASDCLGEDMMDEIVVEPLCDRLVVAMRTVFGEDTVNIERALERLKNAEAILEGEQGDPLVIKAAAILFDVDSFLLVHSVQDNAQTTSVKSILIDHEINAAASEQICRIAGELQQGELHTQEYRVLWDAEWLVTIPEEHEDLDSKEMAALIARVFRTGKGRALAEKRFLP